MLWSGTTYLRNVETMSPTFTQRLLQKLMLGLQFDNEIAAIQVFLVFLQEREGRKGEEKKPSVSLNCGVPPPPPVCAVLCENSR